MSEHPSAPASRWLRAALVAAAGLPVAASLASHAASPTPTPAAEAPPRPGLVFEYYLADRGPLPPGPVARARFRFMNTGEHPATITELKPSCGCLQPRLDKQDYAPGEAGQFDVEVRTVNEPPGPKEYTIRVSYTDPEPREVELTFRAVFPEDQVRVEPPALLVYQVGEGTTEHEVTVTDYRPNPLTVTSVESSKAWVAAEPRPAETIEDGSHVTRLKVRLSGGIPAGRQEAVLRIQTDDERYGVLKVPVFVQTLDQLPRRRPAPAAP